MSKVEKSRVLVVDDNAETCTLLAAILQREFDVDLARDGLEAMERLRTQNYGAILLDLRMPQYDGFSVLEFLNESRPGLLRSVVVVTALLTPRELERARRFNVCSIVPKPFDVDALLAAVKDCVHGEGHSVAEFCLAPMILILADLLRSRLM